MTNPIRHQIEITVRELFNNLSDQMMDPEQFEVIIPILRSIVQRDIEGIRKSFKDGMTVFLIPDQMEVLDSLPEETEIEIRVLDNNGKTLGIIVNDEINW